MTQTRGIFRAVDSAQWKTLTLLAARELQHSLSEIVASERGFDTQVQLDGLLLDVGKQRLTDASLEALLDLANACQLEARTDAMFDGAAINTSEDRAVLHTALRAPAANRPTMVADSIEIELRRMETFVDDVLMGRWRGFTNQCITDVVHIGIGGSHLGPELIVDALQHLNPSAPKIHFVANIDGAALTAALDTLNPQTTLFIIVSKSFTTLETQVNAQSARSWFLERTQSIDAIANHFVAVSTNTAVADRFGIPEHNRFAMWDWVGGRYSLWSAVGLPIALTLGFTGFQDLLAGANSMDEHFRNAPGAQNIPLLMALAGIWNYNFLGVNNHAILPYDERLARLPDYLQQLEMESNGKAVQHDGSPVGVHTMPILWGGIGTNGQHAFHQLLHQGTRAYTADFVLVANADHNWPEHHEWLLANALAQSQAMMQGSDTSDPHRKVIGNHATNTLVMDKLTPRNLGALLAAYEHKVFCQGVIWNINSFDQWGVELGKALAQPIFRQLQGEPTLTQEGSTKALIEALLLRRDRKI